MALANPLTLPCGLELPNRMVKAAMAENISSKHVPQEGHLRVYKEWAQGSWGMILTGNVQVSRDFLGSGDDLQIPSAADKSGTVENWKAYASAAQSQGTPAVVQLNHPGRQSPLGAGSAGMFQKRVSASAVKMNLGSSLVARAITNLIFGTPRPLSTEEIRGPDGIIAQFVAGAVLAQQAGFKGVELHAAHGYLLAQFMSPVTNTRTDEYGGSAAKRARIVVEVVQAIRAATSAKFAIGIKLNSVDVSQSESPDAVVEQIRLIAAAGVDFIEVSGGTYESPLMMGVSNENDPAHTSQTSQQEQPSPSSTAGVKPSTAKREAYFLEFTSLLRTELSAHHPDVVLMVTGGFRSRLGMQAAVESGACQLVGVGRPACKWPQLPKEIILNKDVSDDKALATLNPPPTPWYVQLLPIKMISAGWSTIFYAGKIGQMARGTFINGKE